MTNTKKRIMIVSSVCAIVVIAALVSLFVWKSTFDAEWVIGKTQNEIEQRYGEADIYKNDYIEYWSKERIGYKANRIYFDSNDVAERVEYDYTNSDTIGDYD
jgi:cell division protein FtsL